MAAGVLFLTAVPACAHRLEPINTEYGRPFEPGSGVVKVSYQRPPRSRGLQEAELEVELGLVPRLQLSLEQSFQWLNRPRQTGFGNLETSLRYLIAGGGKYAVSLQPGYTLVTGSRAVREETPAYGLQALVDYFHSGFLYFANVGFEQATRRIGGEPRDRRVFYNFAAVLHRGEPWHPTLELLGEQDVVSGRHQLVIVPEMQYYRSRHFELKVGAPVGLTQRVGVGIQLQAAWSFYPY